VDDAQIRALQIQASRQHGLFTTAQARAVGVSHSAAQKAVERGWIRRVRRSVYVFTGQPPSPWEAILAASLAAGPAAAISHLAAAAIHRFWGVARPAPELTLPGAAGRSMAGVKVHRSEAMPAEDVVRCAGMRVTSPIRTVIDIAPSTGDYLLSRIVDEGAIARLWTAEEIDARLRRFAHDRRHGVAVLRRLVAARIGEGHPDSVLEQRIFRVLRRRVPPFEVHHRIQLDGRILELDVAWPERRIAAEIDGRRIRMTSGTKFESDRLRSNLLERSGWQEIHLTAAMDDRTIIAQVLPLFRTR
jgi:hypothetical protein